MVGGRAVFRGLNPEARRKVRKGAQRLFDLGVDHTTVVAAEQTDYDGFVYVIRHPNFPGHVKIGRAFNPEKRLANLQTGCPFRKYELHDAVYFRDASFAEREIHSRLQSLRQEGEWFRMTPAQAMQAIRQLREEI